MLNFRSTPKVKADGFKTIVAAPAGPAEPISVELIERRRGVRPIPAGEVSECNDADAWALFFDTSHPH
jgi:hypothetical protein